MADITLCALTSVPLHRIGRNLWVIILVYLVNITSDVLGLCVANPTGWRSFAPDTHCGLNVSFGYYDKICMVPNTCEPAASQFRESLGHHQPPQWGMGHLLVSDLLVFSLLLGCCHLQFSYLMLK